MFLHFLTKSKLLIFSKGELFVINQFYALGVKRWLFISSFSNCAILSTTFLLTFEAEF